MLPAAYSDVREPGRGAEGAEGAMAVAVPEAVAHAAGQPDLTNPKNRWHADSRPAASKVDGEQRQTGK